MTTQFDRDDTSVSYSMRTCSHCGHPMSRRDGRWGRRVWECTGCGRRAR